MVSRGGKVRAIASTASIILKSSPIASGNMEIFLDLYLRKDLERKPSAS